ncbi:MAG: hypothetical protein Tsb0017_06820 [Geothermobacteraceae bacterium]
MSHSPVQEAIRTALLAERDAMYFYLRAARQASDGRVRSLFERLAAEERQHLESFCQIYLGEDIDPAELFSERHSVAWLDDLDADMSSDLTDQQALELALKKEALLEESLRRQAARSIDLNARRVYEANADATALHKDAIAAELNRLQKLTRDH